MKIRKATVADAAGIARVHVDSWRATYKNIVPDTYLNQLTYDAREQLWNENLKDDNNYVAENEEGKILGFADGGKERTGNYPTLKGEVYSIYILPENQGQGIGSTLMEHVVNELIGKGLNSMLVWVLKDNPFLGFYEKIGGRAVDNKTINIAGKELIEIAYGWEDLSRLMESAKEEATL